MSRELADFPELAYGLGLLTNDRRPKDIARALARAAAGKLDVWLTVLLRVATDGTLTDATRRAPRPAPHTAPTT
ncbi:hypothetical protein AQJ64_38190 [Streptomyces griseoruber]|uniref:Uncharacterized protein n=1 Tax=Streptomyces griseoruber TaxID=1943 RepID=A0A101SLJ3_9ACTN|nr:hypothetical protein AQJ64_38190 [Streptomyces griseoruber]